MPWKWSSADFTSKSMPDDCNERQNPAQKSWSLGGNRGSLEQSQPQGCIEYSHGFVVLSVSQAGWNMISSDPPASASGASGTTGMCTTPSFPKTILSSLSGFAQWPLLENTFSHLSNSIIFLQVAPPDYFPHARWRLLWISVLAYFLLV
jgi:hypothetical protein